MRKLLLFPLFTIPIFLAVSMHAQQSFCDGTAPKISFNGKAPWEIDGSVADWEAILGPTTGDPANPYNPPSSSAFNWASDGITLGADFDFPDSEKDLNLLAYTHDDYNVYFYFHRLQNGSSQNTFLFFCDVNADGLMNFGEPVFSAHFNDTYISSLTLSRYIPNTSTYYKAGKGNYMVPPIPYEPADPYYYPPLIDRFPMLGTIQEVFNSNSIPANEKLKKNEIFSAAITENGYGVELSIPWKYFKYWLADKKNRKIFGKKPLNPGDIFFYHVSIQSGTGTYQSSNVVDNAGSCCAGVGKSGNTRLNKSLSKEILVPGISYRFKLSYTNLTNAAEKINIEVVNLDNFQFNFYPPADYESTGLKITVYPDYNCNGNIDIGEAGVEHDPSTNIIFYIFSPPSIYSHAINYYSAEVVAPPFGNGCFIADISLPPNGSINSAHVRFETSVLFDIVQEYCDEGGGKAINPVGFVESDLGGEPQTITINNQPEEESPVYDKVRVYPSPNNGTFKVLLPQNSGLVDIMIQDYSGRVIERLSGVNSNSAQLRNLKAGFYILKVMFRETGKQVLKKIVVQR